MADKPVPVDLRTVDFARLKKLSTDMPGLMEYAHSVGGFSIVPTEEGAIKGKALQAMKEQGQIQLDMLFEQIQLLAKQVQSIKDRAAISEMIYAAAMKFGPVIGGVYFLYQNKAEDRWLSMVSPEEWGEASFCYIAKVKLLADHTWQVLDKSGEFQIE